MEWDDLKHFLALARAGNLTSAGHQLKTSPSTVGRRIDALEKKLGVRLFDRKQSGYSLTAAGRSIVPKASEIEEGVLALERGVVGTDSKPEGKVRIAASDDIAAYVISPRLPDMFRKYPSISIELVTQMEAVDLSRREADVALRGKRPASGDFLVRQVGTWPFGLYCSREYAALHNLRPGKPDWTRIGVINWTEEYKHLRGGSWFATNANNAPVALASNSPRVHYTGCKAGLGVAILPAVLADTDEKLMRLLPPEEVLSVQLWLVVHRDLSRAARVRSVMEFLADAAAHAAGRVRRR